MARIKARIVRYRSSSYIKVRYSRGERFLDFVTRFSNYIKRFNNESEFPYIKFGAALLPPSPMSVAASLIRGWDLPAMRILSKLHSFTFAFRSITAYFWGYVRFSGHRTNVLRCVGRGCLRFYWMRGTDRYGRTWKQAIESTHHTQRYE